MVAVFDGRWGEDTGKVSAFGVDGGSTAFV